MDNSEYAAQRAIGELEKVGRQREPLVVYRGHNDYWHASCAGLHGKGPTPTVAIANLKET